MRLMFSRLRRGVALFIYPEMGVEARLKAARGQAARRISHSRARASTAPRRMSSAPDGPCPSGPLVVA